MMQLLKRHFRVKGATEYRSTANPRALPPGHPLHPVDKSAIDIICIVPA